MVFLAQQLQLLFALGVMVRLTILGGYGEIDYIRGYGEIDYIRVMVRLKILSGML